MKQPKPERERSRLVLGLMSGRDNTSAPGSRPDVRYFRGRHRRALSVRVASTAAKPGQLPARLENFTTIPFPPKVRAEVLRIAEGSSVSTGELSQLNFRLGEVFAKALLDACRKFRVSPRRISLIGSHGQTVYHQGAPTEFLGARISSTLQIGEPAVIAARTGITTVGDFRPADMAAGGQGAPLVPFVDYLLYRHRQARARSAQHRRHRQRHRNSPRRAGVRRVRLRYRPRQHDHGRPGAPFHARKHANFDRDARMAQRAQARFLSSCSTALLAEPYFRRPPPKTAGREQYGLAYAQQDHPVGKQLIARPPIWSARPRLFTDRVDCRRIPSRDTLESAH